jgi:hypothetical protein
VLAYESSDKGKILEEQLNIKFQFAYDGKRWVDPVEIPAAPGFYFPIVPVAARLFDSSFLPASTAVKCTASTDPVHNIAATPSSTAAIAASQIQFWQFEQTSSMHAHHSIMVALVAVAVLVVLRKTWMMIVWVVCGSPTRRILKLDEAVPLALLIDCIPYEKVPRRTTVIILVHAAGATKMKKKNRDQGRCTAYYVVFT